MRILIIGMADSVHLARWLAQFENSEHEFYIISSSPHRRIHPILKNLMQRHGRFQLNPVSKLLSLPLWIADRFCNNFFRGLLVAFAGRSFKPDLIHVLEFQNGGYTYLMARNFSKTVRESKLLLTPYGSDMFWFQNFPRHLRKIRELLANAVVLSSECLRDEKLAKTFGFRGKLGPRIPASGAMKIPHSLPNGPRMTIALKGYQNHWGQALIAIRALSGISDKIRNYQIEAFSCNRATIRFARKAQRKFGLNIVCHRKGALSNAEVHKLFARSAVLIALSKSDGVPASMLEAMANGAIPIQSNTGCCEEWIENNQGGFLINYDDEVAVQRAVLKVLGDGEFADNARVKNYQRIKNSITPEVAMALARQTYDLAREN